MNEVGVRRDISYELAKNIQDTIFEDLPTAAVDAARKSIVDTLGVIIGASGTIPSLEGVVKVAREEGGGRPESTIVAFGGKVSACMAAFANGAMAHCLDYDDLAWGAMYHPSSALVPAGFAIAEKNSPTTGRDFITAVAVGQDLGVRLALATPKKPCWHRTVVLGVFAAAATASKLLKLNREQVVDALGIALCQSAGTQELRWGVGSDIGGMYAAFPAKAGVLSALLAQNGVAGIKSCFEGKAGLFNAYFDGIWNREALVSDLGKKYAGANTGFKAWPACGAAHSHIDAVLRLVRENNIRLDDIQQIVAYVGDRTMGLCEPPLARQEPATTMDAKYSIPYCVATALVRRKVGLSDFAPAALKDPQVLALAHKVIPQLDQRLNVTEGLPHGAIEIKMTEDKVLRKEVIHPLGHPENPLSWEAIEEKFRDCARHAAKPLSERNIDQALDFIKRLEQVEDVAQVMAFLG